MRIPTTKYTIKETMMNGSTDASGAARARGACRGWIMTALSAVALMAATTLAATSGVAAETAQRFVLITKSNASPYWLAVKAGAQDAAKKYGVQLDYQAPATDTDLQTQIGMVNNAVTSHANGIILAAQQPDALTQPVRHAKSAGVHVVTVDSGIEPGVADSNLATDNAAAAAALATFVAKEAGGKGSYGIINFNETADVGISRPKGFRQGMAAFPDMKLVGTQICGDDVAKAKAQTEAMIQSNPGIKMIYGADDRCTLGIAQAVRETGNKGKVLVAGSDAELGVVDLIRQGVISASVLQSPYDMGYRAVESLVNLGKGQPVPKSVDTKFFIITPRNIDSPQAQSFLKQYLSAQ
ncbi:sugar ABC transporter substrate-binding protein [Paraburkholderia sp.]|uniref:sugar ABC transporter substrate-binding protein n=1 Tax=Paraburkholderia sp. TaxID=1926495 RepID=UPI0039E3096F